MRKEFLIGLCGLCLYGCLSTGCGGGDSWSGGDLTAIDVESAINQPQELSLTDLGEQVSYIPLETTDESLVKLNSSSTLAVTDEYIYIADSKAPIICFDRKTGKYLRNVGGIGQGPQEYTSANFFRLNPTARQIDVGLTPGRSQCYDYEGNWVETRDFGRPTVASLFISYSMGDKMYSYISVPSKETTASLYCYDIPSRLPVDSLPLSPDERHPGVKGKFVFPIQGAEIVGGRALFFGLEDDTNTIGLAATGCFWDRDGEMYMKEYHNDTIFRVKDLHHMEPVASFHMGEYGGFKRFETTDNMRGKYFIPRVLDSEDRIYFTLYTGMVEVMESVLAKQKPSTKKPSCGIYNKRTGEVKVQKESVEFKHTLEGMPPAIVFTLSTAGEWIAVYQAEKLVEARENIPEAAQPDWLKQLREDDNPVIMVVK